MGELNRILKEFDIRFADRDDDENRSEFSFGGDERSGLENDDDDDRVIDFRDSNDGDGHDEMDFDDGDGDHGEMDFDDGDGDHGEMDFDDGGGEDTFAGEKRVDITDRLRKMLGLDDDSEETNGNDPERFMPSLSDLDLDSEDHDDDDDEEFDFSAFNRRGNE